MAGVASNYRRWWNNSWAVVEQGGQQQAGDWTSADEQRLQVLVMAAHAKGLWIRFYTLNGHAESDSLGWTKSYNFGSLSQARLRWRAAVEAGVDFIATDQYEAFAAMRLRSSAN
jgi:glycerophosphoryl diester phosphodiesterase